MFVSNVRVSRSERLRVVRLYSPGLCVRHV